MKLRHLTACAAAVAAIGGFALAASPAMAAGFGYQVVTEDNVTGYVGVIPTSAPAITVASDGESSFDPFHAGYDTSDGIQLNSDWAPDPAYAAAFAKGFWTQLPGTFTWVLPACNFSGCENANIYEPIAKWDFTPGGGWNAGTLGLKILDPNGEFSDLVTVANDGLNGGATITFQSGNVPEPATWAMMLVGFGGLGAAMRLARRKEATARAAG